jgi:mannose-6-phosphate isomerase-like protein (cupin superfamily)
VAAVAAGHELGVETVVGCFGEVIVIEKSARASAAVERFDHRARLAPPGPFEVELTCPLRVALVALLRRFPNDARTVVSLARRRGQGLERRARRVMDRLVARVGQEMVNPVTRERFVWGQTAASTGGKFVEFDLHLGEGATVAGRHTHPHQREDFRVESGAILLRRGNSEERLEPGDERSVDPGVAHTWANVGGGDAHVVVRLTPALRSEEFFETFCGLAQAGKAR